MGNEEREWGYEMRGEEWEKYLLSCFLVGPSHQPSVIMAVIAEDQRTSA